MRQLSNEVLVDTFDRLPAAVVIANRRGQVRFANGAARRLLQMHALRVGGQLPETSPLLAFVSRASDVGMAREAEMDLGERTVSVVGILDSERSLVTLVLDDVSNRSRRSRSDADFVVNAAHEILGPIAAIAGAVDVLQGGAKDDPAARDRFLAHIADACDRLTSTATALLVLARAESGLGGPRLELVPVRRVLDDVMRGKDDVRVNCDERIGVLGDTDLLRQAVATLVDNARQHSRDGVEISVAEDAAMVSVDVVDHGHGILPENLAAVTDRFVTDRADAHGYGVGLSIAERAARVLGGRLELESDGSGTTARLLLPSARLL